MAIKRVFKSRIPSCSYFFKNGKQAAFIGGKYVTDVDIEIAELESEIGKSGLTEPNKSDHPHIYIDQREKEINTEALDPIAEIKRKAVEEYLAAQKKALNAAGNVSSSKVMPATTGMVNSTTIAEGAAGSDSNTAVQLTAGAAAATLMAKITPGPVGA